MSNSEHLHKNCLDSEGTALVIIDVQEAFTKAISSFRTIIEHACTLTKGFNILGLPVFVTEQYPKGLGGTAHALKKELKDVIPIPKTSFSCTLSSPFMEQLNARKVSQIVVCGVEAHVCINQSVHGFINAGYQVHVPVDAVGSRFEIDYITALRKMELAGAIPGTVESILFELIKTKDSPTFKSLQKLIL